MPKIRQNRMEENQRRIESAALALFTRQGFHGTNTREIAQNAEISTGAIYTYYPTKEALFESLVRNYEAKMKPLRDEMFHNIRAPFSKDDIRYMASAIRSMIYDNADYWLLMYIDVIEFKNQHFVHAFRGLTDKLRHRVGPRLNQAKREKGWCGKDPGFVFATMYTYLMEYFLIEKLFQGNRHLGVSDEEAVEGFVELFSHGMWSNSNGLRMRKLPQNSNHHPGPVKNRTRAYSR